MTVTAAMVKELREKTGAGMMDCKKALAETNGDMEAAIDWLRAKGIAKADKKSGRTAAEGLIGIASSGTKAVVVEINSKPTSLPATMPSRSSSAASPTSRLAPTAALQPFPRRPIRRQASPLKTRLRTPLPRSART